jgi:hypothetical protein
MARFPDEAPAEPAAVRPALVPGVAGQGMLRVTPT